MKKRSYRLLNVIILVLALIIPYFSTNVCAASSFTLENGSSISSILYVNHSYNLKVGTRKVYYYTSNSSIVGIGKKSGKLVVKEPGKVTITAKTRGTSYVVCKKTFTVKRRSDYITSTTKTITMVTGAKKTLSIKKSPTNSTDVIRFKTNNKSIATVGATTGIVKAVGAGTTNIVVYSKASAAVSNSNSGNRTLKIKVKVYSSVSSAKQISLNEVKVTFGTTPSTLAASDFTLTSSAGKSVTVSSVTTESKTATLTLSQSLTDGKEYTLTYKTCSCKFTASDGVIKSFEISPTQIAINTETAVVAYAYDKNGIQLGEYTYGTTYSGITFTLSSSYITTNKKLKFTSTAGTATARIIYKQTVNGVSTTIADSGSVTIKAYDPDTVSSMYRCYITNSTSFTFTTTTGSKLTVPVDSSDFYAHFSIYTASNKEVTDYSQYVIESANTDVLIIFGSTLNNSQKFVSLYPVKTGTTYIYIKDTNGAILYSFPITITTASVLNSITANKTSLTLSNSIINTSQTLTVSAYDQYGNSKNDYMSGYYSLYCSYAPTQYVSVSDVNSNLQRYVTCSFPYVTFYGYGLQPGSYRYVMSCDNKTITFYVTISGSYVSASPVVTTTASVSPSPTTTVTATTTPTTSPSPSPSPSPSTVTTTPETSEAPETSTEASTEPEASQTVEAVTTE